MTGPWFVEFDYGDEGHCTGPWATLDDALKHVAVVAERLILAPYEHGLRSITFRDEQ